MTTTAPGEYRIRAALYRALGDGAPLPPCPTCGSPTWIGNRYSHSRCADFTYGHRPNLRDDDDPRYGSLVPTQVPCSGRLLGGSRYCAKHRAEHPDEPPLPTDDHGHTLRCSQSLAPPWLCERSSVD